MNMPPVAQVTPLVYCASPLGFSESGRLFLREQLHPLLLQQVAINDPWKLPRSLATRLRPLLKNQELHLRELTALNRDIAMENCRKIRASDAVFAVLDGQDVDSGTAAEIGFAYALGKYIIGYRGDFRMAGDNMGDQVNLQVRGMLSDYITDLRHVPAACIRMKKQLKPSAALRNALRI